jgi:hypothetical protein
VAAYRKVAEHERGAPFAEEALLRRAQILTANHMNDDALIALAAAQARFPRGTLAPERAVLEAKIHLAREDAGAAANALDRVKDDRTLAVLQARVEVAEALAGVAPLRARALVEPVLRSNANRDLISRAKMIVSKSSGN